MPEPQRDESAPGLADKRPRREIRYDAVAAVIAALVGMLALLVAGYTAYIQRQQVRALVVTQQLTYRFKLTQEQLHRVDTDHQMRARANHAPHVIAATAAHVQNGAPGQVGKVRQNAIPFPV